MKVPIGEMREPVAVLTPSTTKDESGGEVITYTQGEMLFAAIRPLGSREQVQYGQVNAMISLVMFMHYQDAVSVDDGTRIRNLETAEEYEVVGLPMHAPDRGFTKLTLTRRAND